MFLIQPKQENLFFLVKMLLVLDLMSGCNMDQNPTQLAHPSIVVTEAFREFDPTHWSISQQTADTDSQASSSFAMANASSSIQTQVTSKNQSCLSQNNVNYVNDTVRLSARNQSFTCFTTATPYVYSGGELRSLESYRYGTFDMAVKTSLVSGAITSIYLYQGSEEVGFHFPGNHPTQVWLTVTDESGSRWETVEPEIKFQNFKKNPFEDFNTSTKSHHYGLLWEKDLIQWSIDGVSVFSIQQHRLDDPMQLILATWVTSDPANGGEANAHISVFSDVESVLIQQKEE